MQMTSKLHLAAVVALSLSAAAQQPAPPSESPSSSPASASPAPQTQAPADAATKPDPLQTKPDASPTQVAPAPKLGDESKPGSVSKMPPAGLSTTGNASAVTGIDNARYVIGAEDALQITVWREPTLSGTFPVRPDGMISMVLVGDLPAAGLTPTALGIDITQRLRRFVQDPAVTVQVMAVNSQRVYLIGEVGHVGPVALSAGMTPLQAIATAGGLSPFANSKHIYVLRGSGASQQKLPFNYKQALKGENQQPFLLRSGDTIVVP